jgi:uncharacterized protein
MKIGSCISKKGELTSGKLKVATYKRKGLYIPVHILEGKHEGETIFISGGMHGDELNGIELVQRFIHSVNPEEITGRIILLPVMNVSGYLNMQRNVVYDDKDLNRAFPGVGSGVTQNIAKTIYDIVKMCDFGIDCHDSGSESVLLPHVRARTGRNNICDDGCTMDMGSVFGAKVILQRKGLKGMLAVESYKRLKIPVLTVEIGGAFTMRDDFLLEGIRGIKNVLINNGIMKGKILKPKEQHIISDKHRSYYTSKLDGILRMKFDVGDDVHKGDILAEIHDPIHEKKHKLLSKTCGFIFSRRLRGIIDKNKTACTILQTAVCSTHKTAPSVGQETI